ncbi:ribonuclease H-like domain-containing protein [Tanacetum coccineum]
MHGPKPNETIKRHNGPKVSPDQTGYGSEGSKTDERLPEDASACQQKSNGRAHVRKSRLQADPRLTRAPLWPTNKNERNIRKPNIELTYKRDFSIWEVIQKGNGSIKITTDANGQIKVLPPKTVEEIQERERERKARTTLLMALPEHHLAKFHKMTDTKKIWEAIKSRFGGNNESKKMQKYMLKKQFESFSVSNSKGLHKGYDRFQSLLSQLEIHGAGVSTKDANQKFLSAPQLDHEDLKQVDEFDLEEIDLKWQVAMISMRMKKFYKKTGRKLQFDAKEPVGFDKTKVKCFNCHKTWHFARECRSKGNQESKRRDSGNIGYKAKENVRTLAKQDEPKALVTIDGDVIDWSSHAEKDIENYAFMAYSTSNSGSDNEVTSCSKVCEESYVKLKKLYDEQREQIVPPPMTGNYMPPNSDLGIDESNFTYGPKQSKTSESDANRDFASCDQNSSVEIHLESVLRNQL